MEPDVCFYPSCTGCRDGQPFCRRHRAVRRWSTQICGMCQRQIPVDVELKKCCLCLVKLKSQEIVEDWWQLRHSGQPAEVKAKLELLKQYQQFGTYEELVDKCCRLDILEDDCPFIT